MPIESINPYTGRTIRAYEEDSSEAVNNAIASAHRAFKDWRTLSFDARAERMRRAAAILRDEEQAFAELMALEMGKPVAQGRSEARKCAWVLEYYADNARAFLNAESVETRAVSSQVVFEPLGVILAVMPWNFPFWQVFRFAAPTLMSGNTAILKHASNVSGCALAIADVFDRAGLEPGVFNTVLVPGSRVGTLIDDPRIRAVTLTGSTPAGKAVAARAGAALKKTVLELGGSDPYLILDDVELPRTAADCAFARLVNAGQSCVAAKRFVVLESVREQFEELFVAEMSSRKLGDPLDDATMLGPQARHDLRDELHAQVLRSIRAGARLLLGGSIPDGAGALYPPTVLTDVTRGMPAYHEELFGPVAAIIPVADEAEAVRVANDTVFGLGAAVYTSDDRQADRVVAALEAGNCFINGFVRSDPRLPFGGIKESGYGRELSSYGIREFVNIKTVCRIH